MGSDPYADVGVGNFIGIIKIGMLPNIDAVIFLDLVCLNLQFSWINICSPTGVLHILPLEMPTRIRGYNMCMAVKGSDIECIICKMESIWLLYGTRVVLRTRHL